MKHLEQTEGFVCYKASLGLWLMHGGLYIIQILLFGIDLHLHASHYKIELSKLMLAIESRYIDFSDIIPCVSSSYQLIVSSRNFM